jgi:hypothetical protein
MALRRESSTDDAGDQDYQEPYENIGYDNDAYETTERRSGQYTLPNVYTSLEDPDRLLYSTLAHTPVSSEGILLADTPSNHKHAQQENSINSDKHIYLDVMDMPKTDSGDAKSPEPGQGAQGLSRPFLIRIIFGLAILVGILILVILIVVPVVLAKAGNCGSGEYGQNMTTTMYPTDMPIDGDRSSCHALLLAGETHTGNHKINSNCFTKNYQVYCDQETDGGGWMRLHYKTGGKTCSRLNEWELEDIKCLLNSVQSFDLAVSDSVDTIDREESWLYHEVPGFYMYRRCADGSTCERSTVSLASDGYDYYQVVQNVFNCKTPTGTRWDENYAGQLNTKNSDLLTPTMTMPGFLVKIVST